MEGWLPLLWSKKCFLTVALIIGLMQECNTDVFDTVSEDGEHRVLSQESVCHVASEECSQRESFSNR